MYINVDSVQLTEKQKNEIVFCLEKEMQGKEFLAIQSISSYADFPDVGYRWNEFLIEAMIDRFLNQWKVIQPVQKIRKYQKGIITRVSNSASSLDEVVLYILQQRGNEGYTVEELMQILRDEKIILKVIPFEVLNSDKFETLDGLIFVRKD